MSITKATPFYSSLAAFAAAMDGNFSAFAKLKQTEHIIEFGVRQECSTRVAGAFKNDGHLFDERRRLRVAVDHSPMNEEANN